jgi:hypothetical protein
MAWHVGTRGNMDWKIGFSSIPPLSTAATAAMRLIREHRALPDDMAWIYPIYAPGQSRAAIITILI